MTGGPKKSKGRLFFELAKASDVHDVLRPNAHNPMTVMKVLLGELLATLLVYIHTIQARYKHAGRAMGTPRALLEQPAPAKSNRLRLRDKKLHEMKTERLRQYI